ncbi:leucine-rich repeat protein [Porcipelethomonas ammoniilytica]|uniref:leucine-rich repeat protein n=1 Tax=Porcipelethomonas ammoniilytica TaxID=2981722 RepID=UPI000821ED05|nr:leucine-rich repeat protein [Porcipelethomonas ammoniilytica]MCU6720642.1 leucine-rich repeat protein [Porcipelethomonas ammoniilytica]SCJ19866.1 Endoglucanase A precursor [uncultured Ruminococcus sp.]
MKLKKLVASAMSLLCLFSVNIIANAEEIKSLENIEVINSGTQIPDIYWQITSNGTFIIGSDKSSKGSSSTGIWYIEKRNPNDEIIDIVPTPYPWNNCNRLIIKEGIETIEKYSFFKSDFETVEIPQGIVGIKDHVFNQCENLKYIVFPSSLEYIDDYCFCNEGPDKYVFLNENTSISTYSLGYSETNGLDKEITIYGYEGGLVEEFANKYSRITFISLDDIKGDVQTDAEVNTSDVVLLQKYLVKNETLNEHQLAVADINNDGQINVFDLMLLKRKL